MYLELLSRIPVVAAQTYLGTARIQEAQDACGLSNEAIARQIHISEKTWRRWKQAGSIPTSSLPAAARALRLELRELSPSATEEDRLGHLEEQLETVLGIVQEIRDELLVRRRGLPAEALPGN